MYKNKLLNFLLIVASPFYLLSCSSIFTEDTTQYNIILDKLNTEDKEYFKLIYLDNPSTYYNKDKETYNNVLLLYKNKSGE